MTTRITLQEIEKNFSKQVDEAEADSPLQAWYLAVRQKPICEFDDEDLCIACRQQLFEEYVVPVAISRLKENPLAGEKYDGELIVALNCVSAKYWRANSQNARSAQILLSSLANEFDDDLKLDIAALMKRLQGN